MHILGLFNPLFLFSFFGVSERGLGPIIDFTLCALQYMPLYLILLSGIALRILQGRQGLDSVS